MSARTRKRSVTIAGHRTSVSLEDAFWSALKDVAQTKSCSLADLIAEVDEARGANGLSSAIRVYLLNHFRRPGQ